MWVMMLLLRFKKTCIARETDFIDLPILIDFKMPKSFNMCAYTTFVKPRQWQNEQLMKCRLLLPISD